MKPNHYFRDLSALFFPSYCGGCGTMLHSGEDAICLACLAVLPRALIHDQRDNRAERLFWGRVPIEKATAFLHMPKTGITHRLIHSLKYGGHRNVGVRLGKLLGTELRLSATMNSFDLLLPVPLHPRKEYLRGYNQCDAIVEGMSLSMQIPHSRQYLSRRSFSESQTRKSRFDRWKNTDSMFMAIRANELSGRHVLLVDDVITTGSTIEACYTALTSSSDIRVSVAALALPVR